MKLSVIISNRNDIVMLIITIRSCIEAFKALGDKVCEVVVCDNSDPQFYDLLMKSLPTGYIQDGQLKIIRQADPCLFTAREEAAKIASAPYIVCLDGHMLVGYNTFPALYNFMEDRKDDPKLGFAHAPLSWAHQHERSSKHDRDMTVNELGNWNTAYSTIRKITWKGMPWICRRDWFLSKDGLGGYGALSKHSISWGGGDMHIGVKPWLLGYENWAVPTDPCIHIGPFPKLDHQSNNKNAVSTGTINDQDKYRRYTASGNYPHAFGFLVSCYVLGGEAMMKRNKEAIKERFGIFIDVDKWWKQAIKLGEEERQWLLEHQKMEFDALLQLKPWNN